ncbi:hypothetical protein [Caulobacter mirabilis]|uniref:Uncharacterized protein n=1 Tax=Caulobacter mirabilis TaxID=69666 RepID=A0A2D2AV56_9CAUL|nr:hypothetical protein [Caulobacter mirabilis]ATQ41865.1 hypothetical protein CSW64_05275 [Caulobacter mirabilis]
MARPNIRPIEIRPPRVASLIGAIAMFAVAALPAALWFADPELARERPWFLVGVGAFLTMFALGGLVYALLNRLRLYPDRLEYRQFAGTVVVRAADIVGYRPPGDGDLMVEYRTSDGHGRLTLPGHLSKNPDFVAWVAPLKNLDLEDYQREEARLEANDQLGVSIEARQERLLFLKRLQVPAWVVSAIIGIWFLFGHYGRDVALALVVAMPLVGVLTVVAGRGGVSLLRQSNWPGADLGALIVVPMFVLVVATFGVRMIDTTNAVALGLAVALVLTGLLWLTDRGAGKAAWPMALFYGCGLGWGLIVVLNERLDLAAPQVMEARVVARSGAADDDPALTLASAVRQTPLEDMSVSAERFEASPIGATVCLAVHPGRFGLRYAFITDCPGAALPKT